MDRESKTQYHTFMPPVADVSCGKKRARKRSKALSKSFDFVVAVNVKAFESTFTVFVPLVKDAGCGQMGGNGDAGGGGGGGGG